MQTPVGPPGHPITAPGCGEGGHQEQEVSRPFPGVTTPIPHPPLSHQAVFGLVAPLLLRAQHPFLLLTPSGSPRTCRQSGPQPPPPSPRLKSSPQLSLSHI